MVNVPSWKRHCLLICHPWSIHLCLSWSSLSLNLQYKTKVESWVPIDSTSSSTDEERLFSFRFSNNNMSNCIFGHLHWILIQFVFRFKHSSILFMWFNLIRRSKSRWFMFDNGAINFEAELNDESSKHVESNKLCSSCNNKNSNTSNNKVKADNN